MSTEPSESVRSLLPHRFENIDHRIRDAFANAPFPSGKMPAFLWEVIGGKATEAVQRSLDLNVFGLFARAWCKGREIRRLAIESRERSGVPMTLFLGKHEATTSLEPEVEVTISGLGTHRVPFALDLAAEFESAEITLLDGAIVSIGKGACRVTAQMKLGGQPLHEASKSQSLKLGSPYVLDPKLPVLTVGASPPAE